MARSVSRRRVVVRESYYWPDQQLNFWILVMLAAGGLLIGVFASFIVDQQQLEQGIPWIMPYGIAVGALTVLFILIMLTLIFQRRLLPGLVMLGSFILLALYIAGAVETAIQLFGPVHNISTSCQTYITSQQGNYKGLNVPALAWLEQNSICQLWDAVLAFWIIGAVFLVYMIILGWNVARGGFGER